MCKRQLCLQTSILLQWVPTNISITSHLIIPLTIYYQMLMMVLFGNTSKAQKFYARESCQRFQHQVKAVAALIQCCSPIIPLSIKAEQELVSCPTSFVRSGVWRYDHWLGLAVAVHWVVAVTVAVHSVLWFEFWASWTWQTDQEYFFLMILFTH